jgi:Spy/CpxP family protein refolding chaperone
MEVAYRFFTGDAWAGTAEVDALNWSLGGTSPGGKARAETFAIEKTVFTMSITSIRRTTLKHLAVFLLIFVAATAWGQSPQPADDPIAQNLFSPELVMKYRQEINLEESQSKALKELIQKAQSKFLDLQWDAQSESEKLAQLLKGRSVDENAVLSQMDQVLNREREIKKTQISLLVRIKNLLTEAQQNKLMDLRRNPT